MNVFVVLLLILIVLYLLTTIHFSDLDIRNNLSLQNGNTQIESGDTRIKDGNYIVNGDNNQTGSLQANYIVLNDLDQNTQQHYVYADNDTIYKKIKNSILPPFDVIGYRPKIEQTIDIEYLSTDSSTQADLREAFNNMVTLFKTRNIIYV